MELPDTSMRSGPAAARARSSLASASGSVLDIAGVPLLLRGTTRDRSGSLDDLFGGLPASEATPVAEITYGRRRIAAPRRPPDESYADLDVWHDGQELRLASDAHGLRAIATPDAATITGPGTPTLIALRRLLHPVLTHVLGWRGTFVVHGAALRRDDLAYLVVGDTGQGKSTLALAALEHGWHVLADDLVAIASGDDGDLVARGVPKPLAVPGDLDAAASAGAEHLAGDWRQRRHLPADRLDPRPARLAAVVVAGHGHGKDATIEMVSSTDLTPLLFSSFMSTPDPLLLRRFFPVGAALARLPLRRLRHSAEPSARLAAAARAMDELDREVRGQ